MREAIRAPFSHRRQIGPDHIGIDAGLAERRAQLQVGVRRRERPGSPNTRLTRRADLPLHLRDDHDAPARSEAPAAQGSVRTPYRAGRAFHPKEAAKLGSCAGKLGIGSVYKRLGFLLQRDHPDQAGLIDTCRANLSAGYAKLDPALPAVRLATAWRVWVPTTELREAKP